MRVGIIGGGAVGLLFAHFLSEKHAVTVYTRTEEQAELINHKGLNFIFTGDVQSKKMTAMKLAENVANEELLIVTVKQYQLEGIYDSIKHFLKPILFLQNGYGHIEFLKMLHSPSLFVGVVEHGALKHNPNTIEHTGLGKTKLAVFRGKLQDLRIKDDEIKFFPFEIYDDYHSMLLEKLIVNAVINPLTAILGVPNGELVSNPFNIQVMEMYFDELATILQIQNKVATLEHVKQICRMTSENRSSMLKDLENGRQTEIDAILGYILRQAKHIKQDLQLTLFLYTMIKGKENQKG